MEKLAESLGGLIIVTGFVLMVYFVARYTFLIYKMLAEKGLINKDREPRVSKVDIAYVVIGIGVGLLVSAALALLDLEENTMDLLAWGIILISGAGGLLVASKQKK